MYNCARDAPASPSSATRRVLVLPGSGKRVNRTTLPLDNAFFLFRKMLKYHSVARRTNAEIHVIESEKPVAFVNNIFFLFVRMYERKKKLSVVWFPCPITNLLVKN